LAPDFFWTRIKIRAPDNKTITINAISNVMFTTTTSLRRSKETKGRRAYMCFFPFVLTVEISFILFIQF